MTVQLGQPQAFGMAPPQPGQIALPPGLQYLGSLDQIIVKQKKEMLEILTGFETCNRYEIVNNMNQQIFFVQEESDCMSRVFCPNVRGFDLHVTDNNSQEVIRIHRDFSCCKGCCWCADGCCGMLVTVEAPIGRMLGYIRQQTSKCQPHFAVYDAADRHMFTIWGPCCPCQAVCCTDDVNFPITDPSEKNQVGNIAKQWRGVCTEALTDADQFALTFPLDMNVDTKCLLIGALFMVDYLVFEVAKNNNK